MRAGILHPSPQGLWPEYKGHSQCLAFVRGLILVMNVLEAVCLMLMSYFLKPFINILIRTPTADICQTKMLERGFVI